MIRWITSSLGTASATSVEVDAATTMIDVRDLVDKGGNTAALVRAKIDAAMQALADGKRVVVCCDYGMSRSNAVAAGILSLHAAIPFDEAVAEVRDKTGENEIKLEPLNAVRTALAADVKIEPAAEARVLITGGSGFIGAALQRRLAGAAYVVAPPRENCDLLAGAVALDLLVKRHRINCIVHLANPRIYTSARAVGDTVTMLRNALDACRENGVRLIHLSNWEVYSGYRANALAADETLPLFPRGPYGEAKMLSETLIEHYRRRHGVTCTILRPSPTYGAGGHRPKFIFTFIDKARRGEPIRTHRFRNGAPRLDLLHIDDLTRGIAAAVASDDAGDFNFGSGTMTSTEEAARAIVVKLRSRSEVMSIDLDGDAPNIRMDFARATTMLGWTPEKSFADSLDELLNVGKETNDDGR